KDLSELLALEPLIPWETKLVRVVGRDPFNWWRRIKINLGSKKGIRFNQPVISVKGYLVGRVSEVGPLTSWVILLGDPNCKFSALIKGSRSQGGIVSPRQYSSDPRVVELTYLPNDVELRPGQAVVTSGLGGGFPKEIPVGQVVDSWVSKDGLYVEARIKLHANLNQLETVRVLTRY
ncbi:MAG: rod shape-determining protein MreC, partial [Verrucomicrobiota bacterium]|nr:rod shape-determining protein MreC [Verrucomicrobiota bacterium]